MEVRLIRASGLREYKFRLVKLMDDGSFQFYILFEELVVEHKHLGFDQIEAEEDYVNEIQEFILQIQKSQSQLCFPTINSHNSPSNKPP